MTKKQHFGEFQPHTLTKHAILDAYLKAWATILVRSFKKVWFVDAFAGEGKDQAGNPGSPLIAARVAEQINSKYYPGGIDPLAGMRVIAFEADEERFLALSEVMQLFVAERWHKAVAILRKGTLEERLDGVIKAVGDSPTLYFLDPFGIDGLSADVLPRLLAGPRNELLILFNDEGAVRLAGKVRAGQVDEEATLADAEAAVGPSLFGEEHAEEMREAMRAMARRSLAGHKSNMNAERIMDTAFGGDWWRPIIDSTHPDARQAKFVELYESLLERIGGTKRLRFSVDTPDGRHKYYLIHAAKDARAYAVMKDAMHRARNRLRSQEPGVSILEHIESGPNVVPVADQICHFFAGKQGVRWQGTSPNIKSYAIDETPLWYHECDALQVELVRRGLADVNEKGKPQKPRSYSFPLYAS
ncbi:hypothetical protein BH23GEM9_BH23GEM9_20220 [soil metagenome]